MSLTIVIVTFKSNHLIDKLIKSVPEKFNILVVENSLDLELKKRLELNNKNVEVHIPKENLGYTGGVNYGVKFAHTKYVFCLVADVIFEKKTFLMIEEVCDKFDNFAIIAPTFNDESTFKNYIEKNQGASKKIININENEILEVKEVDGAAFVINKDKFTSNVMDDKIFMYFESTDMCLNALRRNEKIYAILNIKFNHLGLQSSEEKYSVEIIKNRNWHYCWSKFYFYKKNYSYIFALRKIAPNFFRSLSKIIRSTMKKDNKSLKNAKAEISGILNAILNKKSFYRPKTF